jgi:hypothetical protein
METAVEIPSIPNPSVKSERETSRVRRIATRPANPITRQRVTIVNTLYLAVSKTLGINGKKITGRMTARESAVIIETNENEFLRLSVCVSGIGL